MLLVIFLILFGVPIVLGLGVVAFVAAQDRGSRVMAIGLTVALVSGIFWGCLRVTFSFDVTRDNTGEATVNFLKALFVALVSLGILTTFVGSYFAMKVRTKGERSDSIRPSDSDSE